MFKIVVPGGEFYDEDNNEFISISPQPLQLEHSLLSISRWESKWNRSFFDEGPKTDEEWQSYIRDMTITQNVNPKVYKIIPTKLRRQIETYINLPMTATTIGKKQPEKIRRKKLTTEIIYYWMICYGIPFECEKWHFNRLMMLIQVCSEKANAKKETPQEARARTRSTNLRRRAGRKG